MHNKLFDERLAKRISLQVIEFDNNLNQQLLKIRHEAIQHGVYNSSRSILAINEALKDSLRKRATAIFECLKETLASSNNTLNRRNINDLHESFTSALNIERMKLKNLTEQSNMQIEGYSAPIISDADSLQTTYKILVDGYHAEIATFIDTKKLQLGVSPAHRFVREIKEHPLVAFGLAPIWISLGFLLGHWQKLTVIAKWLGFDTHN